MVSGEGCHLGWGSVGGGEGMEEWWDGESRDGGMDGLGMEGWRDGGMEGWRDGGMEGWRG